MLRRHAKSLDRLLRIESRRSRTKPAWPPPSSFEFFVWRITFTNDCLPIRNKSSSPRINLARFWNRFGSSVQPNSGQTEMNRETSCGNKPCGRKPSGKLMYRGQIWLSVVSSSVSGHEQSCAGTKYFTAGESSPASLLGVNLAIRPYISIMERMSLCDWPSHRNSANTWSTKRILRRPVSSSSFQAAAWRGFLN